MGKKVKMVPVTQMSKKGGKATLKKYGPDHFRKLAFKMHKKRRAGIKKANETGTPVRKSR